MRTARMSSRLRRIFGHHGPRAVAVPVRMNFPILFPEQVKRHTGLFQFLMDVPSIRKCSLPGGWSDGRIQPGLQCRIVQIPGQRPFQTRLSGAPQVLGNCPQTDPAGGDYMVSGRLVRFCTLRP